MQRTRCTMNGKKMRAWTRYGAIHTDMPRFEPYSAELIKQLRMDKGLKTQEAFSKASGIDINTIKRLESGMVKDPGTKTLGRIGKFFGLYIYAEWPVEEENDKSPD